jgi:phosphoglucosamine mutase
MTNVAIEFALRSRGVNLARAQVGDRYVLEELVKRGWQLGGESSGHLLALDKHSTGDGIISALLVLEAVVRSGKSVAQMLDGVELFPQILLNVPVEPGSKPLHSDRLANARSIAEKRLGGSGRVLIRASGTEAVLRIMVEAHSRELAQELAESLADACHAAVA